MNISYPINVNQPSVRWLNYLFFAIGTIIYFQLPVLGSIYVEHYGFSPGQSGILMSADMAGTIVGPATAPFWIHRVKWRPVMIIGICIAVIPNFLSYLVDEITVLMALRFTAGLGAGMLMTFIFPCIAAFENPDREFGIAAAFMTFTGASFLILSPFLIDHLGKDGLFLAIGLFILIPLPLIKYAPHHNPMNHSQSQGTNQIKKSKTNRLQIILGLLTVFLFFTAMDTVWPFLELLGASHDLSRQLIANILSGSLMFSILGASMCAVIAGKVNRSTAVYSGMLLTLVSYVSLTGDLPAIRFAVALCLFNFSTTFVIPMLNGWVASNDKTGRVVVLLPIFQTSAGIVGPALGGMMVVNEIYVNAAYTSMVILMICLLPYFIAHHLQRTSEKAVL